MVDATSLRTRTFDAGGLRLSDVGEDGVIERVVALAGAPRSPQIVLPAGDDAAIWRSRSGCDLVASQDATVEGQDFQRDWATPFQVGRRALGVALSDLAAMGARPVLSMATVCCASSTHAGDLEAIVQGIAAAAEDFHCPLVGGDLSEIDGPLVIDVAVVGEVPAAAGLRRDRGRIGDLLVVTGVLGRAAAGLQLLRGSKTTDLPIRETWIESQLEPRPRLSEGAALVDLGVMCGGDLSDGVLVDAGRTAAASGCGVELWRDALPVDRELAAVFPTRWLDLAIAGGEDFELLAAVPPDRISAVLDRWPRDRAPLHVVGQLVSGGGTTLRAHEGEAQLPIPTPVSRHFA